MDMQNYELNRARREELLREAEAYRLAGEVEKSNKSKVMLAALGRGMVKLGEQLARESAHPQRRLQPES
jgi:hypothetical protein